MFARNESRTGEFYDVETGVNHDRTITNDLMFEFVMDLLDMQNCVLQQWFRNFSTVRTPSYF